MGLVTSWSGRKAAWWRPTWALVTPVNAIRVGVGLKKLSVKSAARHARSPRNKSSSPAWRWRWPTTTSCPLHCWSNCSTRSTTPTWQGRCRSSLRSKWRLLLNALCKTFKLLLLWWLLLQRIDDQWTFVTSYVYFSRFCVCQCDQIWRNFTNFGKIFKVLGNFSRVYVFFGKILGQLFHIYFTLGQILIDVNGQLLKNNLAIWSHFGQSHPIGWKAFWIVWISRNGCCNQK